MFTWNLPELALIVFLLYQAYVKQFNPVLVLVLLFVMWLIRVFINAGSLYNELQTLRGSNARRSDSA